MEAGGRKNPIDTERQRQRQRQRQREWEWEWELGVRSSGRATHENRFATNFLAGRSVGRDRNELLY